MFGFEDLYMMKIFDDRWPEFHKFANCEKNTKKLKGVSGSCRTDWDREGEGCFERRIGILPALLRVCPFRVSPLFQLPASEGHSASQDSKEMNTYGWQGSTFGKSLLITQSPFNWKNTVTLEATPQKACHFRLIQVSDNLFWGMGLKV